MRTHTADNVQVIFTVPVHGAFFTVYEHNLSATAFDFARALKRYPEIAQKNLFQIGECVRNNFTRRAPYFPLGRKQICIRVFFAQNQIPYDLRSEERRVGKEC